MITSSKQNFREKNIVVKVQFTKDKEKKIFKQTLEKRHSLHVAILLTADILS